MNMDIPVWINHRRALKQYPWMDGNATADVCVIGGGVTGTLIALGLAEEGVSVVLLTGEPVGFGASARLTPCSFLDWGQDVRGLIRRVGSENAALLMSMTREAAERLEELNASLPGGTGFARRDCVIYADSDADADQLRRRHAEYRRLGMDCSVMDRDAFGSVFAFPAAGALVLREGAVETDPWLLAQRAAAEASDRGVIIFENTKAQRVSAGDDGKVRVYTSTCRQVTADHVVIAAGQACGELMEGITAARTRYMAASTPLRGFRGWPGRCVVRSAAHPGLICCTSPDERVFVSSEASPGADSREHLLGKLSVSISSRRRYEELEAAARYLFPELGLRSMECGWSFRGLRTADDLPAAGEVAGQPGCLAAVSGGEGGVLLSVMLSRLITDCICGRKTEGLELLSPSRRRLAG